MKNKDKKIQMLRNTIENISNWREEAIEHDEDADNEPREFCEDVSLIEDYAKNRLDVIFDGEDSE